MLVPERARSILFRVSCEMIAGQARLAVPDCQDIFRTYAHVGASVMKTGEFRHGHRNECEAYRTGLKCEMYARAVAPPSRPGDSAKFTAARFRALNRIVLMYPFIARTM
jgi:hypothetical protein